MVQRARQGLEAPSDVAVERRVRPGATSGSGFYAAVGSPDSSRGGKKRVGVGHVPFDVHFGAVLRLHFVKAAADAHDLKDRWFLGVLAQTTDAIERLAHVQQAGCSEAHGDRCDHDDGPARALYGLLDQLFDVLAPVARGRAAAGAVKMRAEAVLCAVVAVLDAET